MAGPDPRAPRPSLVSLPPLPTFSAGDAQVAEPARWQSAADWMAACDADDPAGPLALAGGREPPAAVEWAVRQARGASGGRPGAAASAARCHLASALCALRPRLDEAGAAALSLFLSTWPVDIALDVASQAAAQPPAHPPHPEPLVTLAQICTYHLLPTSLFCGGPRQSPLWPSQARVEVAGALLRLVDGPSDAAGPYPLGAALRRLWDAMPGQPSAQSDAASEAWLGGLRLAAELPPGQRARFLDLLAELIERRSAPPAELFGFLRRAPADAREQLARRLENLGSRGGAAARVLLGGGELAPLAWLETWERLRLGHGPPLSDGDSLARIAAVLRARPPAAREGILDAYRALADHPSLAQPWVSDAQAADAISALAGHPRLAAGEGWRADWLPTELPGELAAAARRVAAAGHPPAVGAAPPPAGPAAAAPRAAAEDDAAPWLPRAADLPHQPRWASLAEGAAPAELERLLGQRGARRLLDEAFRAAVASFPARERAAAALALPAALDLPVEPGTGREQDWTELWQLLADARRADRIELVQAARRLCGAPVMLRPEALVPTLTALLQLPGPEEAGQVAQILQRLPQPTAPAAGRENPQRIRALGELHPVAREALAARSAQHPRAWSAAPRMFVAAELAQLAGWTRGRAPALQRHLAVAWWHQPLSPLLGGQICQLPAADGDAFVELVSSPELSQRAAVEISESLAGQPAQMWLGLARAVVWAQSAPRPGGASWPLEAVDAAARPATTWAAHILDPHCRQAHRAAVLRALAALPAQERPLVAGVAAQLIAAGRHRPDDLRPLVAALVGGESGEARAEVFSFALQPGCAAAPLADVVALVDTLLALPRAERDRLMARALEAHLAPGEEAGLVEVLLRLADGLDEGGAAAWGAILARVADPSLPARAQRLALIPVAPPERALTAAAMGSLAPFLAPGAWPQTVAALAALPAGERKVAAGLVAALGEAAGAVRLSGAQMARVLRAVAVPGDLVASARRTELLRACEVSLDTSGEQMEEMLALLEGLRPERLGPVVAAAHRLMSSAISVAERADVLRLLVERGRWPDELPGLVERARWVSRRFNPRPSLADLRRASQQAAGPPPLADGMRAGRDVHDAELNDLERQSIARLAQMHPGRVDVHAALQRLIWAVEALPPDEPDELARSARGYLWALAPEMGPRAQARARLRALSGPHASARVRDLLARIWLAVEAFPAHAVGEATLRADDPAYVEAQRANMLHGTVKVLADAHNGGAPHCEDGHTKRLLTVLQGYIEGIVTDEQVARDGAVSADRAFNLVRDLHLPGWRGAEAQRRAASREAPLGENEDLEPTFEQLQAFLGTCEAVAIWRWPDPADPRRRSFSEEWLPVFTDALEPRQDPDLPPRGAALSARGGQD